jgi:hypothetical protein
MTEHVSDLTVTDPSKQQDSEHPSRAATVTALGTIALLVVCKLALHLATVGRFGYSYFVDELYYLDASHHLAWGFVDFPPLFPAITALIRWTIGESLWVVRVIPALSGAALIVMTALMARDLGGRRFAQGLAGLGILVAPLWLALHSIYTMNALDQLLWTGCAWLVIRIIRDQRPQLWLWLGAVAGLGLLNKHAMAFFLLALGVGILLTPERRALRTQWFWLGGVLAGALFLPNLVWVVSHHFPHFEALANIRHSGRDVRLNPFQFVAQEIELFNPLTFPLWASGLAWFLFDREGRRYRILGWTFLGVIAEMLLLDGRVYYPAPAYPMLFAAGGIAIERWFAGRAARIVRIAYPALLAVSGLVLAPLFVPILPPETYARYTGAIHLAPPQIENHLQGPLPQLFADTFGWKEMATEVARIYYSLPPSDRAKAAILGQNYGQAGAIDLFGPALGLPPAISGHLSYFLWGPREYTGEVTMILDDHRERLEELFGNVQLAGHVSHPYSMPYQHFDVWVCRQPRQSLQALWPQIKKYN